MCDRPSEKKNYEKSNKDGKGSYLKNVKVVEMNQSDFDKLVSKLEKLSKKGQYVYAMTLYKSYPLDWSLLIRNFDHAAQQCIKDDNLDIPFCPN